MLLQQEGLWGALLHLSPLPLEKQQPELQGQHGSPMTLLEDRDNTVVPKVQTTKPRPREGKCFIQSHKVRSRLTQVPFCHPTACWEMPFTERQAPPSSLRPWMVTCFLWVCFLTYKALEAPSYRSVVRLAERRQHLILQSEVFCPPGSLSGPS